MAGMEAGVSNFLGFLRSKNPKLKNGMDGRQEAGCFPGGSLRRRRKLRRRKSAGMRLFARARDRSGIFAEQKLERIARFFAASPQKMRPEYDRAAAWPEGPGYRWGRFYSMMVSRRNYG
jgi:hypothetical protein